MENQRVGMIGREIGLNDTPYVLLNISFNHSNSRLGARHQSLGNSVHHSQMLAVRAIIGVWRKVVTLYLFECFLPSIIGI